MLVLGARLPVVEETRAYAVDLMYGQTIPKPFCAQNDPYLHVQGPLRLRQEVSVSASGAFSSRTVGSGELVVTPVNPLTGAMGVSRPATIHERHGAEVDGDGGSASGSRRLRIHSTGAPQQMRMHLRVGPGGATVYSRDENCGR